MSRFRYCQNASTIATTPILRQLEVAREAGYEAIELWHDHIDAYLAKGGTLRDLYKAVEDSGLSIPTTIYLAGPIYVTALSSRPPPGPPPAPTPALTLGEVTAVDDPDRLGRVRVRLPAHGGLETGWLAVLGVGAGPGKGLCVVPDAGDQVVVAVVDADQGQAIVLGGLFGGAHPDPGVEGASVRRFSLRTAGGHRLTLDDHARTVRLSDAGDSHLELGPDAVILRAAAPLTIDAHGQPVVIRASTIDFERR